MRVLQATKFGGPEVLVPSEAAELVAGPSQVVVEVSVAPVLFLDTQIRSGSARAWFPATPPYVPGRGVAGAVSSVGAGVDPDWVGCRVVADTADGGYLERVVVAVEGLIAVPEGLGMAEAAALLHDGRTAVSLLDQAHLRAGERVLVLGAGGGLGSLLVQLAHRAGARVIGAARGRQKLDLAEQLGADAVVDYSQSGWLGQVLAHTGGAGADMVFDGVGGEIGRTAFAVTAHGGRFSSYGTPGGGYLLLGGPWPGRARLGRTASDGGAEPADHPHSSPPGHQLECRSGPPGLAEARCCRRSRPTRADPSLLRRR
jgi:NADPH2:quinone reductase